MDGVVFGNSERWSFNLVFGNPGTTCKQDIGVPALVQCVGSSSVSGICSFCDSPTCVIIYRAKINNLQIPGVGW